MTVASTTSRIDYSTTAGLLTYPYPFQIYATSDLEVYKNEVKLTLDTHYTVTNPGVVNGGNVVLTSDPGAGAELIIRRLLLFTQGHDYVENDKFPAESHEVALDRLTMLTQQLDEARKRSPALSVVKSYGVEPLDWPFPTAAPDGGATSWVTRWNAQHTNLEIMPLTTQMGLLDDTLPLSTRGGLPVPGTQGKLRKLTDIDRAIWIDTGSQWISTAGEVFNVALFGATGDGSTDDTAAIQAGLDALPVSGGVVFFPSGRYRISAALTVTNKPVVLRGDGAEVSVLIQTTAGANGLTFSCTLSGNNITGTFTRVTLQVSGLSFIRDATAGGKAIVASWVEGTDHLPYCVVQDVLVNGGVDGMGAWAKGVELTNVNGARIDGLTIGGDQANNASAAAEPYGTTEGLHFIGGTTAGKIDHILSDIHMNWINKGIRFEGWHEGIHLTQFQIAHVGYGVHFAGAPTGNCLNLYMKNGHINYRLVGVHAVDVLGVVVEQVDLLQHGGATGAIANTLGVNLDTTINSRVVNCTSNVTNASAAPAHLSAVSADRVTVLGNSFVGGVNGVAFPSGCDYILINANHFAGLTTAITIGGTFAVVGDANSFFSVTTRVNDAGTGTYNPKRQWMTTVTKTLTGGQNVEYITIDIPSQIFVAKPDAVFVLSSSPSSTDRLAGFYDYDHGNNSAIVAYVVVERTNGALITPGTARFSVLCVGY